MSKELIAKLDTVNETTSEGEVATLLESIVANASESSLRERFRTLLSSDRQENAYPVNVLAAGVFGVLPGSKYLQPAEGTRVNPFLHKVRKAMLGCGPLNAKLRENASKYIFYPEFLTLMLSSLRPRIAAVARAHANMGPKNDELSVLYSLGGYFDKKEADGAVKVTQAGGTTCVMTARAIYHAAGAKMLGQRIPTINTPLGPNIELGVPTAKTRSVQKDGIWKNVTTPSATVERDDRVLYRNGYDENDMANEPKLEVGDIYLIDGDGEFKYLLRGQGALAAHVGVVVSKSNRILSTVDGGAGMGAEIKLNENRKMLYESGLGWTFSDASSSYSQAQINQVDEHMKQYQSDSAVEQWILTSPDAGGIRSNYTGTKANYDNAVRAGNDKLAKIIQSSLKQIIAQARNRIRILKANTVRGAHKTIQGWWKPERYEELSYVGYDSLKGWLN